MQDICQQSCCAATKQSKASKLVWECSIQHLMLISSVLVPLRVTDKQFYLYSVGKRMPDTETTPIQL